MAKLYVFGIGGTGARVLRSFTFLLASGVKLQGFNEVVPVIIDADSTSGDKTDTVSLMQDYIKIFKKEDHTDNAFTGSFFSTKISSCCDNNFTMAIPGGTSQRFKDYMKFNGFSESDQALIKMLYSEDNLNSSMEVGFKGNPNIGSVVLNELITNSDGYKKFANSFQQGDAIFIISSIFGGTGASGFPLLLHNLRNGSVKISNSNLLAQCQIGALSVLPYFNLKDAEMEDGQLKEDQLDGSSFIQKTRAALKYYYNNIKGIDQLYYIGDDVRSTYENHNGGALQKNQPHFVELVGALSIFNFAEEVSKLGSGQKVHNPGNAPTAYEFGIKEDLKAFGFSNLHNQSLSLIQKPLTKFLLMRNYFAQALNLSWKKSWANTHEPIFNSTSVNEGGFCDTLSSFLEEYRNWLKGMAENSRSFQPFDLETTDSSVFNLVKGVKPESHWWLSDKNFDLFNNRLDKTKRTLSQQIVSIQACWMDLFARTTDQLVSDELHL